MQKLRWFGLGLVVLGVLGFFTVADDLRHTGEIIGVSTVLLLGLILVGWSYRRRAM